MGNEWTEEALLKLIGEGRVEIDEEHSSPGFAKKPPYIKEETRDVTRATTAKKQGIPVPKEYCFKLGATFASQTEAQSMTHLLEMYEPEVLLYEPVMFRLPSGSYTPDWLMVKDGKHVYYEVKGAGGFSAYKSGRSSKKSLIEAAYHLGIFGEFRLLMKMKGGAWHEEVISRV